MKGLSVFRFKRSIAAIVILLLSFLAVSPCIKIKAADGPSASNVSKNLWGNGGQISFDMKDCTGYLTITAVVEFDGTVESASGWGFDSYTVDGNQVTAVVKADGGNSWAFNSNVGIQVTGSSISIAEFKSISGSGTYTPPDNNNNNNNQDNNQNNNNQNNNQNSEARPEFASPAESTYGTVGDDWLTTKGSKIVDMNSNEVWLTGVNWFGYNTGTNLFDGLWNAELESSLKAIADHGFNLMRVPMSAELLLEWKKGNYPTANYNHAYNGNLNSLNSLEIFDYVLTLCEKNGMKVMVDIHSANTDASGHNHPVWYTDKISEDQYIDALKWLADRYKNFDTIVAYDLKNEPHGKASESPHAIWNDSNDKNNWKKVAERAGNAILDINPHALIVIEGIQIYPTNISSNNFTSTNDSDYYNTWWGANLMAVKKYPIDFGSAERNKQVVYSPHDYGPLVYEQPWFSGGFDYDSLYKDAWYPYWLYIVEDDIAPILIGEWGGFMSGDNLKWMQCIRDLIGSKNIHHTFWCFNANSGDTGGLVKDDFKTWDEDKYNLVKPVLWQNKSGKFISLDHAVALGANGISLADYSGNSPEPVINAGSGSSNSNTDKPDSNDKPSTETEKEDTQTTETETEDPSETVEEVEEADEKPETETQKPDEQVAENSDKTEELTEVQNETTSDTPEDTEITDVEQKGPNTTLLLIVVACVATLLFGIGVFFFIRLNSKENKHHKESKDNENK